MQQKIERHGVTPLRFGCRKAHRCVAILAVDRPLPARLNGSRMRAERGATGTPCKVREIGE
jgi:hypothetical protein